MDLPYGLRNSSLSIEDLAATRRRRNGLSSIRWFLSYKFILHKRHVSPGISRMNSTGCQVMQLEDLSAHISSCSEINTICWHQRWSALRNSETTHSWRQRWSVSRNSSNINRRKNLRRQWIQVYVSGNVRSVLRTPHTRHAVLWRKKLIFRLVPRSRLMHNVTWVVLCLMLLCWNRSDLRSLAEWIVAFQVYFWCTALAMETSFIKAS